MPTPVSFSALVPTAHETKVEQKGASNVEFQARLEHGLKASAAAKGAPQEVRAARTRLSGQQAATALEQAWVEVTGKPARKETIAVLTAQWAHETGHGASMYNYNFGGIKGRGPSGLTVHLKTREGWGQSERRIVDGFRAYRTASEGAVDYVKLLTTRYKTAVVAAEQGDAAGFVKGLKARGYFTGNESAYVRSVDRLTQNALAGGFSSLGKGGNLPSDVVRAVSRPEAAPREGVAALNYQQAAPFVDAMTIADEISRAALRIAAHNEREEKNG
jgi:hypothetical protein